MPYQNDTYNAIGLMSGTSLDGLDIAFCSFNKSHGEWQYNLLKTTSIPYDNSLSKKLRDAIDFSNEDLAELDVAYGIWLGQTVHEFIKTQKINVDLIASHGHTIFHEPEKGITRQIGAGQSIANITGKKVVSDFRSEDVALGGQGAPLVPIGDKLLFGSFEGCLNLGGIANISYDKLGKRIAYDVGMANMPLNYLANQLNFSYDKNGDLARSGKIDNDLLLRLNDLSFFKKPPPKSLGIEWFLAEMKPLLHESLISTEDKLATVVEHEAQQITHSFSNLGNDKGLIMVTGGGALNTFLIERIKTYLPQTLNIHLPSKEIIEFKEAMVFAFLGVLKVNNVINCFSSVTGASRDTSSGRVSFPQQIN